MQHSITLISKWSAGGFGLLVLKQIFYSCYCCFWKCLGLFNGEIRNTSKTFLSSEMTKTSGGFAFRAPILSWHLPFKILFLPNPVNFQNWCDAKMLLNVSRLSLQSRKTKRLKVPIMQSSSTSRCHLSKFKFRSPQINILSQRQQMQKGWKTRTSKEGKRTKRFVEVQVKQIWANRTCHDILISN